MRSIHVAFALTAIPTAILSSVSSGPATAQETAAADEASIPVTSPPTRGAALTALPGVLAAEGIVRFSRMQQRDPSPGETPWTVTTAATNSTTFVCFEGAPPLPRCFDIAAPAQSFIMPFEPRSGFPVRVGIGLPLGPGDVEELLFQLDTPSAEPAVALSNFVGTVGAGVTLPTITLRPTPPPLLEALTGLGITQRHGPVMYATQDGLLSACERRGDDIRCTAPVEVAGADDLVVLEPDAQGPDLFEVEVEVYREGGGARDERIEVAIFGRDPSGELVLGGIAPFGGQRTISGSAGDDVTEVIFEELAPAGPSCVTIGRPEVEHRLEVGGATRALARVRLARAPDVLPVGGFEGDHLLVDSSGTWQLLPTGGMRRVAHCAR